MTRRSAHAWQYAATALSSSKLLLFGSIVQNAAQISHYDDGDAPYKVPFPTESHF